MEDHSAPQITCKTCGEAKPATDYPLDEGRRRGSCRTCASAHSRLRYHTDPRKRAMQLASSTANNVKRRWPEAETGMSSQTYVDLVLGITQCEYCGQPNDGTHAFNLDHRVALTRGGKHEAANLVAACEPCNRAKHDMPHEDYLAWLRGVAERAQKKAG